MPALTVDSRLADLRDALLGLGELMVDRRDLHVVRPGNIEALMRILSDEAERTREQVEEELARLRAGRSAA